MIDRMPAITVYCSSSTHLDPDFHAPATMVGRELARRGVTLVYGGGCVGLMGEIARAARASGGASGGGTRAKVIGIITRRLMDLELGDQACDELIIVDTMRERKRLLELRGDGFLVLPGGLGTYEEFFEILVGRQLGEHAKPIAVLNSHGYFNPLVAMIEHGIEHRFIKPAIRELFRIDPDPGALIDWLLSEGRGAVKLESERVLPMGRSRTA
jgi:uncharacterized protein (TIGR00730 family)